MPADRFLHPRALHSTKVSSLTDVQFRVWVTYQLLADDYGVSRRSAIAFQNANRALATRSKRVIEQALDTLVTVGLLMPFEHQGEPFVCQLTWQDFQKIRYPRETLLPLPPAAILAQCSPDTAELFRKHFGNVSAELPSLPRAGARETANGNGNRLTAAGERLEATGSRLEASGSEEGFGEKLKNGDAPSFEAFWDVYPKKAEQKLARAAWHALHATPDLVALILAAVADQRTWPQWTKEGGRFIPKPANWLEGRRWEDAAPEPLAAAVSELSRQNLANANEAKRLVRART
jgi:hypothetical protein